MGRGVPMTKAERNRLVEAVRMWWRVNLYVGLFALGTCSALFAAFLLLAVHNSRHIELLREKKAECASTPGHIAIGPLRFGEAYCVQGSVIRP